MNLLAAGDLIYEKVDPFIEFFASRNRAWRILGILTYFAIPFGMYIGSLAFFTWWLGDWGVAIPSAPILIGGASLVWKMAEPRK